MPSDSRGAHGGLLLPPDVIQPFPLRFRREDLHVMAFFGGHADYEAVEAMIQHRGDGESSIRAILTRHDQSQIDHVNDAALLAQSRGVQRETCYRSIALNVEALGEVRRARLAFESHIGEHVVLDVTTVGRPDPKGGGLSDPGRHSPTGSLPLMWRGASTLAGPQTQVTIDGVRYGVPVKVRSGSFVAHEGYYTEPHAMGAIRAGTVNARLIRKPDRIDVDAAWVFDIEERDIVYRVVARDAGGRLRIAKRDGSGETITAYAVDRRLEVIGITLPADAGSTGGLVLAFDGPAGFSLSMDEAQDLVTGDVEIAESADGAAISLLPAQPGWAVDRRVRIACARDGERMMVVTTIGDARC